MTLRLTQRTLKYYKREPQIGVAPPTTRLGDWFVNLLYTRHYRLLLCTSSESLLTILVPVKFIKDIESDIPRHIWKHLNGIGIEGKALEMELEQMMVVNIGKTNNRSILGVMNDMAFNAEILLERRECDIYTTIEHLNETPYGGKNVIFPKDTAIERLKYWDRVQ